MRRTRERRRDVDKERSGLVIVFGVVELKYQCCGMKWAHVRCAIRSEEGRAGGWYIQDTSGLVMVFSVVVAGDTTGDSDNNLLLLPSR